MKQGVLVIVSHDRFFTDKVTKHLFVFEGNGVVKDFSGTLSDYSECLVELEKSSSSDSSLTATRGTDNLDDSDRQQSYKEDKQLRMQRMNEFKKNKKEMTKIEKDIEKLKDEIIKLEKDIEVSSDDGWSKLAELTDKMNDKIALVDEKEMRWLELAEMIEEFESQAD